MRWLVERALAATKLRSKGVDVVLAAGLGWIFHQPSVASVGTNRDNIKGRSHLLEPVNKAAASFHSFALVLIKEEAAACWNQSTKQPLGTKAAKQPLVGTSQPLVGTSQQSSRSLLAHRWNQSAKQPLVGTIQRCSRSLEPVKSTKQPLVGTSQINKAAARWNQSSQPSSRSLEPIEEAAARWNHSTKQPLGAALRSTAEPLLEPTKSRKSLHWKKKTSIKHILG
jgi:hypothetical protein